MKKLIVISILLTSLLFAASGKKAPNFSLQTPDGKVIKLSDYKGKIVILNFFATWCPPCKREIPDFVKFYNKNKEKVEIIGIAVGSSVSKVKRMIENYKISYPVVMSDGKVEKVYGGISGVPTTFIIDKNGNIYKKHIGLMRKENLKKIVEELL